MSLPKNNPFKNEPEIVKDIKRIMEGWVQGGAEDFLNENTISEGGVKGAIEDFMYDTLPQAAVKELQPVFKNKSIRGGQLRDKVSAVLKKHKIPTFFMGTSATQVVIDNFETYFGESVEEHGEVLSEAAMIPFKRILKGVNDMEGPFLVVVMRKGAPGAILQKKVPGRAALPAHINYMLSNDLQKLEWKAIAIENANGKIVNIMYPTDVLTKAGFKKEEVEVAEQFKAGDKVKVPHKGKMVKGKIVRYDNGGTGKAKQHGGGYVVDVGDAASILVAPQNVQKEEVELDEASWGGGFQSSADAHREVQAGLKADFQRERAQKLKLIVQVIRGEISKQKFKKLTGSNYDELMKNSPYFRNQVKRMPKKALEPVAKKEEVEVNELTNLRTYNNAYPNTMIASSMNMGEASGDQEVKAAILILQNVVNMARNPSKYGNLKIINAVEDALKQLKTAIK